MPNDCLDFHLMQSFVCFSCNQIVLTIKLMHLSWIINYQSSIIGHQSSNKWRSFWIPYNDHLTKNSFRKFQNNQQINVKLFSLLLWQVYLLYMSFIYYLKLITFATCEFWLTSKSNSIKFNSTKYLPIKGKQVSQFAPKTTNRHPLWKW